MPDRGNSCHVEFAGETAVTGQWMISESAPGVNDPQKELGPPRIDICLQPLVPVVRQALQLILQWFLDRPLVPEMFDSICAGKAHAPEHGLEARFGAQAVVKWIFGDLD
jgi:hypothetical protein